jgi:aryl-alcohol dehydrogenase-like predicted oxidoreductase
MNHLIDRGMAFYWGTSEWNAQQLTEAKLIAATLGLVGPICDQLQYNLFHRERVEREYLPLYPQLGTTVWSPLAGGLLSGRFSYRTTEEGLARMADSDDPATRDRALTPQRLLPIAERLGCTVAQLSLAWCCSNPNVSTVIMGASRPEQVLENLQAMEAVPLLTAEVLQQIDEAMGKALGSRAGWEVSDDYDEAIRSPPSPTSMSHLGNPRAEAVARAGAARGAARL